MPTPQITNAGGAFGYDSGTEYGALTASTQLGQEIDDYINNSGGTLLPGDIVIMDVTDLTQRSVTTTTTANDPLVVGVVAPKDGGTRTVGSTETYASGAIVRVIKKGPARVNIGANTVLASGLLASTTGAKVGDDIGTVGNIIGVALEASGAKDANNTIRAYLNRM